MNLEVVDSGDSLGVDVLLGGDNHQKSLLDDDSERSSRLFGVP